MDVSSGTSLSGLVQQTNVQTEAQISALKAANKLQGQLALTLIQAVTEAPQVNPPNLGNSIDVRV